MGGWGVGGLQSPWGGLGRRGGLRPRCGCSRSSPLGTPHTALRPRCDPASALLPPGPGVEPAPPPHTHTHTPPPPPPPLPPRLRVLEGGPKLLPQFGGCVRACVGGWGAGEAVAARPPGGSGGCSAAFPSARQHFLLLRSRPTPGSAHASVILGRVLWRAPSPVPGGKKRRERCSTRTSESRRTSATAAPVVPGMEERGAAVGGGRRRRGPAARGACAAGGQPRSRCAAHSPSY